MQKNGCGGTEVLPQFLIGEMMKYDAFSKCHPAVNFLFFAGAIGAGVLIQHPAFMVAGCLAAAVYYFLLCGKKGWGLLLGLLPLVVIITAVNPLFNPRGEQVLFQLFGRPYTLEALLYGGAVAGIFAQTMLWFGCYNKVLTGDKFTALFGNLIPAISLLLVMIFRMVPNLVKKTKQIVGTRKSIGKGAGERATTKEKWNDGMTVLGTMTAWALEGGIVTGDSMRARGYGCAKRTSFMIYRMTGRDWLLCAVMTVLLALVITAACLGQMEAVFLPGVQLSPVSWGVAVYGLYLLIPSLLQIKEAIQWHISRSGI